MIHYLMNINLKHIGLILIIVLFGVFSLPKYMRGLSILILQIQIDYIVMRDFRI